LITAPSAMHSTQVRSDTWDRPEALTDLAAQTMRYLSKAGSVIQQTMICCISSHCSRAYSMSLMCAHCSHFGLACRRQLEPSSHKQSGLVPVLCNNCFCIIDLLATPSSWLCGALKEIPNKFNHSCRFENRHRPLREILHLPL
jgi:hypothetical protein